MTVQLTNRQSNYRNLGTRLITLAAIVAISSYVYLSQSMRVALQNDDFYTANKLTKLGVRNPDSSLLIHAVRNYDVGLVQWLVNHGASVKDLSAQEAYELLDTAIILPDTRSVAEESKSIAILKTLLDAGADPNVKSGSQEPLVFDALSNPKDLELLLDHGARVDALHGTGNTLIQMAALWGRAAAIPILAKHGADLNAPDPDGVTPLTIAHHIWSGGTPADYKVTYYALLSAGADPNAWSSDIVVSGTPQTWPVSPPLHTRIDGLPILINGYGSNFSVNWKHLNMPIKWWSVSEQAGTFQATSNSPEGVSVSSFPSGNMTIKLPRSAKSRTYDVTICTEHERAGGSLNL